MLSNDQKKHMQERNRQIRARYAILGPHPSPVPQIAQEFNVTRQTVYNAMKRYGTKERAKSRPHGQKKGLKREKKSGTGSKRNDSSRGT